MTPAEEHPGLSTTASAVVIVSVCAVLLLGVVTLVQRDAAIARWEAAGGAVASGPVTPGDQPAGGTYTVRDGDTLLGVAAALGLSPSQLVYWNRDAYPTLATTPALRAGWTLRTTGPRLPVAVPPATPQPTPTAQAAAAGGPRVPVVSAGAFPASGSVTVSYYAVTGFTPQEISASMERNGPYSEWLDRRAQAQVEVAPSYSFDFVRSDSGACSVELIGPAPVTLSYEVVLPHWTPPANVAPATVEWWVDTLTDTVRHEAHHVELYEDYLPAMNAAVVTGTCASVSPALNELWQAATRANCEFDVGEYGTEVGRSVESCLVE